MVLFSFPDIQNNFFSLSVRQRSSETYVKMYLFSPTVNTYMIPQTYKILLKSLPRIYLSKCFNEKGLSFSQEVKRTEIGHLFEHILLEYIFELKSKYEPNNFAIKGETSWNWKRDPKGMFHILLN